MGNRFGRKKRKKLNDICETLSGEVQRLWKHKVHIENLENEIAELKLKSERLTNKELARVIGWGEELASDAFYKIDCMVLEKLKKMHSGREY